MMDMIDGEEWRSTLPEIEDREKLGALTPNPARAARVREKCRARLIRRHRRAERQFGRRVVAPVIVFGACTLYLASLVGVVLHLREWL